MKEPKLPFEASNYMLFYFAAGAADAEGKTCEYVLDRTQMWDCTDVPGCSSCYEFVGLAANGLNMRALPCPCESCCSGQYEMCTLGDIVPAVSMLHMTAISTDSPEYLQLPLSQYNVRAMKNFMRRHEKRVPGGIRKEPLIELVQAQLFEYLLPADIVVD
jgi:hypothetical protein